MQSNYYHAQFPTLQYDYGSHWQDDFSSQLPESSITQAHNSSTAQMRLIKISSDVLPPRERAAIIDSRSEGISVGRDRAFGSRLRIPSMEISKDQASIFYLEGEDLDSESGFAISDIGSTHGTFVISNEELKSKGVVEESKIKDLSISSFTRLSPSKKASKPFFLNHLDVIKFGKTLFRVHLHDQGFGWSCDACSLSSEGGDEIALSHSNAEKQVSKLQSSSTTIPASTHEEQRKFGDRKLDSEAHRRVEMKDLKASYLGKKKNQDQSFSSSTQSQSNPVYLDRAAARRSRNINSSSSSSSASSLTSTSDRPNLVARETTSSSQAPKPLDASNNKGFLMFSQMARGVEGKVGKDLAIQVQTEGSTGLGYLKKLQVLGEEEPDRKKKRKKETSSNQVGSDFDYRESVKKKARDRYDELQ